MCDTLLASSLQKASYDKDFQKTLEKLFQVIRSNKLLPTKKTKLYEMILASVSQPDPDLPVHQIPHAIADDYPWNVRHPRFIY